MNTDPLKSDSPAPAPAPNEGSADEREVKEAAAFMQSFDDARAGVAVPDRSEPAAFALAAARTLTGGADDAELNQARARLREQLVRGGTPRAVPRSEAAAEADAPERAGIPLSSVLFARLLARLGLGVLDVVVLLIAILIGSQVLMALLKKNETKPVETTAEQKKENEKKLEPAGEDKPEKAAAPDPHWLDELTTDHPADELESIIEHRWPNQKLGDVIAAAQDSSRDVFIRRALLEYLSWRIKQPTTSPGDPKAVGVAALKLAEDDEAPTLLRKSAIRTSRVAAELAPELKDATLKALSTLASRKDAEAPLRAEALDALIKLDPVSTDKVIGETAAEADANVQEKAFGSLRDTLAKSPDAAAHLADTTVNTLVALLGDEKATIGVRVNAAQALAYAVRNGNATARKAGLSVIAERMVKAQENALVLGLCNAAEIMGDGELVPALKKTYQDFYDAKNPEKDGHVRVAVLKAFRAYLARISKERAALPNADLKAGTEVVALLVQVIDEDREGSCLREAMKGLKYIYSPIFKAQQADAVEALFYLMKDKRTIDPIKQDAAETLESITSMDFGMDTEKWGHWFDKKYGKGKP